MASIRKRKDSYQITVSLGRDINGKQIIETTTYIPEATTPKKAEKEVKAFADAFEKKCKDGKYLQGEKVSFYDFIPVWREDWAKQNLTVRTLEDNERALRNHIVPEIGNKKIAKIQPSDIQAIITKLNNAGLKPATVKKNFSALNSVMRYAYKMQVIQENPCDRCELPKMQKDTSLHYFTLEQSKAFLRALTMGYQHTYKAHTRTIAKTGETYEVPEYTQTWYIPLQYQAYFTLAIYGGFRRGELLALTWKDIDFENYTVSITKSVSETEAGLVLKSTKTVSGNRKIMLPASCFMILRGWLKEQKDIAEKLGSKWKGIHDIDGQDFEENRIFIQLDSGLPMDIHTPYQKFKSIIEEYNNTCEREEDKLPSIRLHDLRHTSATLLLSEGCDIETVSRRMGHSKASITLDVYGHALETMDTKASSTLDKLFNVG